MSDTKHIESMEMILNTHSQLLAELESVLDRFEAHQEAYQSLKDYYTSPEFLGDVDLSNQGKFTDIACGILSEDAVYNLLTDHYQLGIRLLEVGTDLVKKH